eukprot:3397676-Lingulodinium_polyedra.AAC.1
MWTCACGREEPDATWGCPNIFCCGCGSRRPDGPWNFSERCRLLVAAFEAYGAHIPTAFMESVPVR